LARWWRAPSSAASGDECQWIEFIGNNVYGDPGFFTVDDKTYAVQLEYDNARHACSMAP
jgi:hypothetical protein